MRRRRNQYRPVCRGSLRGTCLAAVLFVDFGEARARRHREASGLEIRF